MIQLITFDLDNTLWDSDPVIISAERVCWEHLTKHYPKITDAFTLESLRSYKFELADDIPAMAHKVSDIRKYCMRKALEKAGYNSQEAEQGSLNAFNAFYEERQNFTFYDDAKDMLHALAKQYRLAALTNGNADLTRAGLEVFEFGFNAEAFDAAKPEPPIFEAALKHADVRPQQVLHIGDHQEHDVFGAHRLNMHTLWFNQHNEVWQRTDCKPHIEAHRLSDIPALIAEYQASL